MASDQNTIMNADGIYLAIFAALRFNLKLIIAEHYNSVNINLPLTEVGKTRLLICSK